MGPRGYSRSVAVGRDPEVLRALVERAESGDAAAVTAIVADGVAAAGAESGDADLGFRAACIALEHILANPGAYPDDTARERYSSLCDEHAADPARMARLRPLGQRLHQLERDGVLPRSMVVRSRRRRE